MPIYDWMCKECDRRAETLNSMDDSHEPPPKPCECGAEDWTKLLNFSTTRYFFHD